jgi:predicted nucleotidyltransferase
MFFEYIQLEDYLSEILGVKVDSVMKYVLKPAIPMKKRETAKGC